MSGDRLTATSIDLARLPTGSRVQERRLDNGVRLLAVEVPTARQARLVAAVGAGYLDEPAAWPGLAHLLEHALFLGSPHHPRPGDFAAWIGEQGGSYNAHTGEYVTDVHLSLPLEATEAGLERLLDLIIHPSLAADRVIREVEAIDAEFHARLADPALHRQVALSRLYRSTHPAYHCHHGHRRSLGNDDGKEERRLQDALRDFHGSHYRAERLSLVLLGPQPAERQLDLMERAARDVPAGAAPSTERTWRWAAPARVHWSLPLQSSTDAASDSATLELLWPLPEPLPAACRQAGQCLCAALADGVLAATLQRHDAIRELDAELRTDTTAPTLALTLLLTAAGQRQIEPLLATCQARASQLAESITALPRPSSPEADLDGWAKTAARHLAVGLPVLPTDLETPTDASDWIDWLRPDQCRVLLSWDAAAEADEQAPDTGTRLRLVRAPAADVAPWPFCPAPDMAPRRLTPRTQREGSEAAQSSLLDAQGTPLFWGGGPAITDGFLGLAWPTPDSYRPGKLAYWRQRTLALRQAADAHGLGLFLGGEGQGDWLLCWGNAERLEPCLAEALDAWPRRPDDASLSTPAAKGLLAQRLLAQLDEQTLPGHATMPGRLAWAGGSLGEEEARSIGKRLFAMLPEYPTRKGANASPEPAAPSGNLGDGPTQWLPSQGDDHALMLQIDAPHDDACSRLLLKLLAQCHDAAFQYELRQRQALGYAVAVRYREEGGWPRLGYVVQSPEADIATLRQAVIDFLIVQGTELARMAPETFDRRKRALAAAWGAPETTREALLRGWQALRHGADAPTPWQARQHALASLTPDHLIALAERLATGRLPGHWWAHAPVGRRWD